MFPLKLWHIQYIRNNVYYSLSINARGIRLSNRYWGFDAGGNFAGQSRGRSWQKMFLPNVGYYQNKVMRIDNVDFILSTLWSRIPPVDEFAIQNGMNDYAQILYNKRRLIPQNINFEFDRNLAFIKQAVRESDAEKIVVVTHHHPIFSANEGKHKGNVLNAAYATKLGNYISGSRISAWISGHSHHSTDLMIGNTHLVSNPLGYVFCGENTNFNDSAAIEV